MADQPQPLEPVERTALVLSGGGAHGSFAVGALQVLRREAQLDFDLMIGTSTGALVAALALIDELDALERIYTSVTQGDILAPNSLFELISSKDGVWNSAPLRRLIERELTPARFRAIMTSPRTLVFTTVNLKTGRLEYWSTKPLTGVLSGPVRVIGKDDLTTFKQALLASASVPIFMESVRIAETQSRHTDGGLREIAGIELATELGAARVYAILMGADDHDLPCDNETAYALPQLALRVSTLAARETLRNDVEVGRLTLWAVNYIRHVEEAYLSARLTADALVAQGRLSAAERQAMFPEGSIERARNPFSRQQNFRSLYLIRPRRETLLEGGTLDFDPEVMRRNLERGRLEGRRPQRVPEFAPAATRPPPGALSSDTLSSDTLSSDTVSSDTLSSDTPGLSARDVEQLLLNAMRALMKRPDLSWDEVGALTPETTRFESSILPDLRHRLDFLQSVFQGELDRAYPKARTLALGLLWAWRHQTWQTLAPRLLELVTRPKDDAPPDRGGLERESGTAR